MVSIVLPGATLIGFSSLFMPNVQSSIFMLPGGGVVIVGVHEQSSFGNGPTIVVPTILTFTLSSN